MGLKPVELPIVIPTCDIPCHSYLVGLLRNGAQCVGGFPLWLVGGAPSFTDIDLYANSWPDFAVFQRCIQKYWKGECVAITERSISYQLGGAVVQLIHPGSRVYGDLDLLYAADMSASACLLTCDPDSQFHVQVLYPDDIRNRVCRVLEHHAWTPYRVAQYEQKGYTVYA